MSFTARSLALAVLLTVPAAAQQINPASDVRWPTCSSGQAYAPASNSCPASLSQNTTGTAAGLAGSQTANYVYAGPASGSAAAATWRMLVAADIPSLASLYCALSGCTLTGPLYGTVGQFTSGLYAAASSSTAVGLYVSNSTPATSLANQSSPFLYIGSNYFNGTGSAANAWYFQDQLGTGANPADNLVLGESSGTSGARVFEIAANTAVVGNFRVSGAASGAGSSCLQIDVFGNITNTGSACGTGSGSGTVTSFSAGNLSPLFTTSVATGTTTPALSFTLSTQAANSFFAGPASGSAAAPAFRALVGADLPAPSASALGGIESVASASHNWVSYIDTSGVPHQSQPGFGDLSGNPTVAQLGSGGADGYVLTDASGTPEWQAASSGGDAITSPDSTLSVGGTSSATTLDLNLAHANTWTATQTLPNASVTNAELANPSTTVNGQTCTLGSTCTIATGSGTVTTTGSPASGQMAAFSGATSVTSATAHNESLPFGCTTTNSGNTYSCTTSPSFTPAAGDHLLVDFNAANSGSATLNVNSAGAKTLYKWGNTSTLASGDIQSGHYIGATYDGSHWQLEGQLGNAEPAVSCTLPNVVTAISAAGVVTCSEPSNITGAAPAGSLTGTLPASAEPAHTGDVTNSAGSLAMTVVKVNGAAVPTSAAALSSNSSGQLTAASTTGSGSVVLASSPALTTPALGTPASGVITNLTGTCTACTANAVTAITGTQVGTALAVAANAILKSNGTAAAPVASDLSDNGTTVSSTKPIGISGLTSTSGAADVGATRASEADTAGNMPWYQLSGPNGDAAYTEYGGAAQIWLYPSSGPWTKYASFSTSGYSLSPGSTTTKIEQWVTESSVCTASANSSCTFTVTFANAFADTSWNAMCAVSTSTGVGVIWGGGSPSSTTATTFYFRDLSGASNTLSKIECRGWE